MPSEFFDGLVSKSRECNYNYGWNRGSTAWWSSFKDNNKLLTAASPFPRKFFLAGDIPVGLKELVVWYE